METAAVPRLSDSAAGHEDQVVGIVGVDEVARRRIVDVLERSGVKVGGEAGTLTELLAGDSPPNAVVVSEAESRSAVVEQIQRVRRELPAARVVLVAGANGSRLHRHHRGDWYVRLLRCVRCGAAHDPAHGLIAHACLPWLRHRTSLYSVTLSEMPDAALVAFG